MDELLKMHDALNEIIKIMNGLEMEEMKATVICTLMDVMFKEKSIEMAEQCLEYMKEVNAELGTYQDD